jgi:tRNA(Arg) A34 adenosine deaminase TadA
MSEPVTCGLIARDQAEENPGDGHGTAEGTAPAASHFAGVVSRATGWVEERGTCAHTRRYAVVDERKEGRVAAKLSEADHCYLQRAIEISRAALGDGAYSPFGALVVVAGAVAGEGANRVAELRDPTAHAEIMALRAAGETLGRPAFEDGVLYSSSEPCPMCLTACYWARIPRVVFGATSQDAAACGFEDLRLYREVGRPGSERLIREEPAGGDLRDAATASLRAWAAQQPLPSNPSSETAHAGR